MNTQTETALPMMWKTFGKDDHAGVLLVDGSRVYGIKDELRTGLEAHSLTSIETLNELLVAPPVVDLSVPEPPQPQSISLNISSACNLACSYCYASRGGFNGNQKGAMDWATARKAIDRLLEGSVADSPVTIGYLGGEPFVNRKLLHKATHYAARQGIALNRDVRFSVTTNGTLISADDLELFKNFPFAVTVSIDGGRAVQTRQRPGTDFDLLRKNINKLLLQPGSAKVCARSTVTRANVDVVSRFEEIQSLGFEDIGFSPVRTGAENERLSGNDWKHYLEAMCSLGEREISHLLNDQQTAFSNLAIALKQIGRGAASPYPCGAGGGYFSVASDGRWYACHRAIGDSEFEMGNSEGLDANRRQSFLQQRHVHAQADCRSCWARYLCSGSCHQESQARSIESCDFVRGWLEFCLEAYLRLENNNLQGPESEVRK